MTVHTLRQHQAWCSGPHHPDHDFCTRTVDAGRAWVEVAAELNGAPLISAFDNSATFIEDLQPDEAEALARALLTAAVIARRGEQ